MAAIAERSSNDQLYKRLRPHSARPPRLSEEENSELKLDLPQRPESAHPKLRSGVSDKKVLRHVLQKPHFSAPKKDESSVRLGTFMEGACSDRIVDTWVEKDIPDVDVDFPVFPKTDLKGKAPITKEAWSSTTKTICIQGTEPDRQRRAVDFDSWVYGSPHDSDEYDTDLEDEVKEESKSDVKFDPTGNLVYLDECKKQGVVPISYLSRHLGARTIKMRHHYLGIQGMKAVAEAFKKNTITESLDLSDNYIEAEGAKYLAAMMKENTFISKMNISGNFIRSIGAAAIADMLDVNTTLKTLSISGNQLMDGDAKYFIEALKNNVSLLTLDISHNQFGEVGGVHLGAAMAINEGIVDLDLSWNSIRQKGAVAIANILKGNLYLEVLDLSWNGFSLAGCLALVKTLKINTTLKVLDLSNNRLTTQAAQKLAIGVKNNVGLETLLLNMNPIGDLGVEAILKAVTVNTGIKFLSIEEIAISANNFVKVRELEESRDIIILHGGVGGYQRFTAQSSVIRVLKRFLKEHRTNLEESLRQQDKNNSEVLSLDDMKHGLRSAGLGLTNKQLDILMEEVDLENKGEIAYRDLLNGRILSQHQKQKFSRDVVLPSSQQMMLIKAKGT